MLVQRRMRILSRNVKSQNLVYSCFGASKITATGFLCCFRVVFFLRVCLDCLHVLKEPTARNLLSAKVKNYLSFLMRRYSLYDRDEKHTCSVPDRGLL